MTELTELTPEEIDAELPFDAVEVEDAVEEEAGEEAEEVAIAPAEKGEKSLTKYYVLAGEDKKGPYTLVGLVEASGQMAAKKAAVISVNEKSGDAGKQYFIAIPASSWIPQKPSVEVVTTVGFD